MASKRAQGRVIVVGMGKLQARGQVTVPKEVRDALGAEPGDTFIFEVDGERSGRFYLVPTHKSVDDLLDRYSTAGTADTEYIQQQIEQGFAEDVERSYSPERTRDALKGVAAARE